MEKRNCLPQAFISVRNAGAQDAIETGSSGSRHGGGDPKGAVTHASNRTKVQHVGQHTFQGPPSAGTEVPWTLGRLLQHAQLSADSKSVRGKPDRQLLLVCTKSSKPIISKGSYQVYDEKLYGVELVSYGEEVTAKEARQLEDDKRAIFVNRLGCNIPKPASWLKDRQYSRLRIEFDVSELGDLYVVKLKMVEFRPSEYYHVLAEKPATGEIHPFIIEYAWTGYRESRHEQPRSMKGATVTNSNKMVQPKLGLEESRNKQYGDECSPRTAAPIGHDFYQNKSGVPTLFGGMGLDERYGAFLQSHLPGQNDSRKRQRSEDHAGKERPGKAIDRKEAASATAKKHVLKVTSQTD